MSYKLGYVSNRVGVPIIERQKEHLMNAGVLENDIYLDLDECLKSLRGLEYETDEDGDVLWTDNGEDYKIKHHPDTLYVYTTAILGENRHDATYLAINDIEAVGIYSILEDCLYSCGENEAKGIKTLAASRLELQQVRKNQMAEVGRQLGGRKRDPIWDHQDDIIKMRKTSSLPKVIDAYSHIKGGTESTIRRIIKAGGMD